jgi:hypothetical protein
VSFRALRPFRHCRQINVAFVLLALIAILAAGVIPSATA